MVHLELGHSRFSQAYFEQQGVWCRVQCHGVGIAAGGAATYARRSFFKAFHSTTDRAFERATVSAGAAAVNFRAA